MPGTFTSVIYPPAIRLRCDGPECGQWFSAPEAARVCPFCLSHATPALVARPYSVARADALTDTTAATPQDA